MKSMNTAEGEDERDILKYSYLAAEVIPELIVFSRGEVYYIAVLMGGAEGGGCVIRAG